MDVGYWWSSLLKNTHEFCRNCDSCYRIGRLKIKSLQIGNNTSRGTFYEMGFRFYRSN